MVSKKTALYKVLALVFLFWCWSSGRVEAAPLANVVAVHNEQKSSYVYVSSICYSYDNPEDVEVLCYKSSASSGLYTYIFYSYKDISIKYGENDSKHYPDSSITNVADYYYDSSSKAVTLNSGLTVYYLGYDTLSLDTSSNKESIDNYCDIYYYSSSSNYSSILKYILDNLAPDVPYYGDYVPDWSTSEYDQFLKIENFQASIEDGVLYMTWDPSDFPEGEREFHYIKFNFKQRHPGTVEGSNRRNYVEKQFYIKYKNLCGQVSLSDLELDEGYILSSMTAVPYYHFSDNPEYPLYHGDTTYVYFDDDGISSNPILIDPAVDPDVEEEEVPRTILGSIQNFFSNFWRNITNTAKAAVVPEQDELLGLLGEMNDWFSERFGFIWYPFDLAIDIVAAFGLGEPNTTITVPALTLDMMGGIQLWESFEIDLDPVGFLQYVRFFTSVLMCCGTVSLAIRKWEEWIGGKNQ